MPRSGIKRGRLLLAAAVVLSVVSIPALALGQEGTTSTETTSTTLTDTTSTAPGATAAPEPSADSAEVPPPPPDSVDLPPPPNETQVEQSESAYAELNGSEAQQLLEQRFQAQLISMDVEAARELTPSDYERFFSDTVARVEPPDGGPSEILYSTVPLRDANEAGDERPVDLRVEDDGTHWEAKNPLVDVALPAAAGDRLTLNDLGISVRLLGAGAGTEAVPLDGDKLFYHDAAPSTDLTILPTSRGAEILAQVRSSDAPERLSFEVDLPNGTALSDAGDAGLEIVREGDRVALITSPYAVDSRGTPVPSRLEQTGTNSFDMVTDHRGTPDVVYPVLVDPGYESWYWPDDPSTGIWENLGWCCGLPDQTPSNWAPNGYSAPVPTRGCMTGLNWICWWHGLYVQVGPAWQVAPGAGGEWAYYAPGPTGYIQRAVFGSFNYTRGGETRGGPYLYLGIYSPSGGWPDINADGDTWGQYHNPYTNGSIDCGCGPLAYTAPDPYSGNAPVTKVVFGMANNAWRTGADKMTAHRTTALAGIQIYLSDQDRPTMAPPPSSEVPTEWVDSDQLTLTAAATDATLGVSQTQLVLPEPGPNATLSQTFSKSENCGGGLTSGLCPHSNTSATNRFTFDTDLLYEGRQQVYLRALDPVGDSKHTGTKAVTLWVDHTGPKLREIGGSLAESSGQVLVNPTYDLHVKARDGWEAIPSSGVKSIEVLDGTQRVAYQEQECPQDNCPMSLDWTLTTADFGPGPHQIRVIAMDQLGHRTDELVAGVRVPQPEVIHGKQFDGPPTGATTHTLREEWIVPGTNVSRVKTPDDTTVRTTTPCDPNQPDGQQCDQLLSTSTNFAVNDPQAQETFTTETGTEENDIQIENPSDLLNAPASVVGETPVETGPISSILASGQRPPPQLLDGKPFAGDTYELFETSKAYIAAPGVPDDGEDHEIVYGHEIDRTWVEAATALPIKSEHIDDLAGGYSATYWDYEALLDSQVQGIFAMAPRPGTTNYESVTHHGSDPATGAAAGQQLTAAAPDSSFQVSSSGFTPYDLGDRTQAPIGATGAPEAPPSDGGTRRKSAITSSGAVTGPVSYPDLVSSRKPLVYWRFGENAGADAADSSGHARTASYVASPTLNAPGAIASLADDGAVDLNGTTQYVSGYETRRNLISNPSVENGTAGYGTWGSGSSIARTTAQFQHRTASLKVTAPMNAGAWAGNGTGAWMPVVPGRFYSAAAQVRGGDKDGIALNICYINSNLSTWLRCDARNVNATAGWTKAVVRGSDFGAAPASAAYALVIPLNASKTTQDFYLDAVQFGPGQSNGPYFDGTTAGSGWEGAVDASASAQGPFANGKVRTFEGWAKRDSESTLDMLLAGTSSDEGAPYLTLGGEFGLPANSVVWSPYGNCGNCGSGATWDNAWAGTDRWVHWALVFDEPANTAELFINGQSKGTRTVTAPYGAAPGKLRLGTWGANGGDHYGFDGQIDEVAIYDRKLTPAEIENDHITGEGAYQSRIRSHNPSLYWHLGEDSGQTAIDASGSGHSGTFIGSPTLNASGAPGSGDDGAVDLDGTQYVDSGYTDRLNLIANPSLESNTQGWSAYAIPGYSPPSVARDTAVAQTGSASLRVSNAGYGAGVRYPGIPAVAGKYYSAAAQVRGSSATGISVGIVFRDAAGNDISQGQTTVSSTNWSRAVVNGSSTLVAPAGTTSMDLRILNVDLANKSFNVDAIQLEAGRTAGSYFDGSIAGAGWEGIPNNSMSSTRTGPFANGTTRTFEGWAYRDTQNTLDMLFGGDSSDASAPYLSLGGEFGHPASRVIWAPKGNTGAAAYWDGAWPGTGRWVHWALVYNQTGATAELFINGGSLGVKTIGTPYPTPPSNFRAGSWGLQNSNFFGFDGKLDEIAIFDHALTATEIRGDYSAAQPPGSETDLCLNSIDEVNFETDNDHHVLEDTSSPNYVPPDPAGDELYYAANYDEVPAGADCDAGEGAPASPDLDVVSVPSSSPAAQAMVDSYQDAASDPGSGSTQPVTVGGQPATAYLTTSPAGDNTVLVQAPSATVMVTGDFLPSDVASITTALQEG